MLMYLFLEGVFTFFFRLVLFLILSCAFLVILSTNLFYSVLGLVIVYGLVGVFFALLGAEYVGLTVVIVYVGAIAILFLFVIMLFSFRELELRHFSLGLVSGVIFGVSLVSEGVVAEGAFFPSLLGLAHVGGGRFLADHLICRSDSIVVLGVFFFNFYPFYIVLCGLLLVLVLIGVVVLLREIGSNRRCRVVNPFFGDHNVSTGARIVRVLSTSQQQRYLHNDATR